MAKTLRKKSDGGNRTKEQREGNSFLQLVDAVQNAEKLRLAGKLDAAYSACEKVLKKDPDYVAAVFTMGLILADQSKFPRSLEYLHRAVMFNPHDPKLLTGLSGVYLRLNANLMAARTLEQALAVAPNDANIHMTLGEIYREEKEYELSKQAYEAALGIDPGLSVAEIGLARNLTEIGHLEEAASIYEKYLREESHSLFFLYYLSQLPKDLVSVDLVALLEKASPAPQQNSAQFRTQLAFTKAAAFDKAGRYEDAWEQVCTARRSNSKRSRREYERDRKRHEPLLALARTASLDKEFNESALGGSVKSLFIVGPSRSGKTSLERLVGSLPGCKRGYENPIVENAVRRTFMTAGYPTRSLLVQLPPGLGDMFRSFYLEELAKRSGSARVLTNTLPHRTEDALRAASAIPNARFVFIKRDMDDLSIRIFMRNYAKGHFYASDLRDIRDYLTWCNEMIDVTAARIPEISRVITYEEMVTDPAGALSEVADLCGLEIGDDKLPAIGDDRGCAEPYKDMMREAMET